MLRIIILWASASASWGGGGDRSQGMMKMRGRWGGGPGGWEN
jgi:hypothetical protein